MIILKFWLNTLISYYTYALILIVIIFIVNRKFLLSLPIVVITTLLLAYFVIYLITPHDLTWHLYTSCSRIFQHVYPALIFLLLLGLKDAKAAVVLTQPVTYDS